MSQKESEIISTSKKNNVAVIVPLYRLPLTEEETISLRHLDHFLGDYDRYAIIPRSLDAALKGYQIKRFRNRDFRNTKSYSRLLLSKRFYQAFSEYKFILIYQLDALVFSDQLQEWCEKNYDYIGAPWFKSQMIKKYDYPDACGNGGFSLRKINGFLNIIDRAKKPWRKIIGEILKAIVFPQTFDLKNYIQSITAVWQKSAPHRTLLNEDRFWSFEAQKFDPGFKIPPVDIGLGFAFEIAPRYCFERNNNMLPFGCHAWARYDKAFWLPYIVPDTILNS